MLESRELVHGLVGSSDLSNGACCAFPELNFFIAFLCCTTHNHLVVTSLVRSQLDDLHDIAAARLHHALHVVPQLLPPSK